MRRDLFDLLLKKRLELMSISLIPKKDTEALYPEKISVAENNILNTYAKQFYEKHEVSVENMSAELHHVYDNIPLMTTHHCLKYAFGRCQHLSGKPLNKINNPAFLQHQELLYRLEYDCKSCVMRIYKT